MKRPTEIAGDPSKTAYWRGRKEKGIRLWRRWLAKQGIFFSYPLDLDMMMVRAFPEAYCVDEVEAPEDTSALEASVFGEGPGLAAYQEKAPEDDLPTTKELVAYDKFFKKRGKPGSHLRALAKLTDETIQSDCPEPLRALIKRANKILRARSEQDAAEG